MKKLSALLLVAVILFACSNAFAASPWTEKTTYKDKVLGKLDYGVKNLLGGWIEIFRQPTKYNKDKKSVTEGVFNGLYYAVGDTVGGILHIVTFPVTNLDIPLPNGGVQFD